MGGFFIACKRNICTERGTLAAVALPPMLTTASITAETFSAALLGLEDLSLRVTAATLHVATYHEFLDYGREISSLP